MAARRVIADGNHYESIAHAAASLGMSHATVALRVRKGWSGWRYAEEEPRPDARPLAPRLRRRVRIHGVEHASLHAAVRVLGVSRAVIERRIAQAWPGYEEMGDHVARRCARGVPRPVLLGGVVYRSRSAAAAELGISPEEVRRRIEAERPPKRGIGGARNVWVNGVRYDSITAAAAAHGLAQNAVKNRVLRGWPGWSWDGMHETPQLMAAEHPLRGMPRPRSRRASDNLDQAA